MLYNRLTPVGYQTGVVAKSSEEVHVADSSRVRTVPEIETERLRLRILTPHDLDALADMYSDTDVMRYLAMGLPVSRDETALHLERLIGNWKRLGFGRWAITDKSSGEFVGYSGFGIYDHRLELNYGIIKKDWGKGYATEAAQACLRYGFEEFGFEYVAAVARAENLASIQVMKKLGMKYEKELRRIGFDYSSYIIRKDEFRPPGSLYVVHHAA